MLGVQPFLRVKKDLYSNPLALDQIINTCKKQEMCDHEFVRVYSVSGETSAFYVGFGLITCTIWTNKCHLPMPNCMLNRHSKPVLPF